MNILFIGDIIGRPGRNAVKKILPRLRKKFAIDLVLANGENLAGGLGMTYETYRDMVNSGIDYFTSGNDIWCKKEFSPYLDDQKIKVLRPANFPTSCAGRGIDQIKFKHKTIILINLLGRVFINCKEKLANPFLAVDKILKKYSLKKHVILVDFHAEATSEKNAMGHYLDGRVTAVLGTHTHIATSDARILSKKTAFVTDIGMVGALDSCIGADHKLVIDNFLCDKPIKIEPAKGAISFNAVRLEINNSNNAKKIIPINQIVE